MNRRFVVGHAGELHDATLMPWSESGLGKMLTVLVACKEPPMDIQHASKPGGLQHLGRRNRDWRIAYDTTPNWARAANALLDYAAAKGNDALFLDDDVELTAESLSGVRAHYDQADIFGLDLHVKATGERQAGARHLADMREWVHPGPAYVAHVSTSAAYLKASAIQSGLRFPEWEGIHWEDVAYCFDAWMRALKVMAVPGLVWHDIQGGAGVTKRHDAAFWERWGANRAAFQAWCAERDLSAVPKYVWPAGAERPKDEVGEAAGT